MLLDILIPSVLSILTGVGGWYAARRQNIAEAQSNELDNVEKAVGFYRTMAEEMANKQQESMTEISQLRNEIRSLRKEVKELFDLNQKQLQLNKELVSDNHELIKENKKLLTELKNHE